MVWEADAQSTYRRPCYVMIVQVERLWLISVPLIVACVYLGVWMRMVATLVENAALGEEVKARRQLEVGETLKRIDVVGMLAREMG